MSIIKIKDLADSIDLDRKAMLAIAGGARRSGAPLPYGTRMQQGTRIVNFPGSLTGLQFAATGSRQGRS